MNNVELDELKAYVRNTQVKTLGETAKAVEDYMARIVWSQLKNEWIRMGAKQKNDLVKKLFADRVVKPKG